MRKMHHVLAQANALVEDNPGMRRSPASASLSKRTSTISAKAPRALSPPALAREYGDRVNVVEPYAAELPTEFEGTGAKLVDIDTALETCGVLIVLVDHDVFKVIPAEERGNAAIYDTRGIWPDARVKPAAPGLRLAS